MKKVIIISVVAVSVALIGLALAAGPGSSGWHLTPEEKVEFVTSKIAEKLALDDAQRAALDRIADDIVAEHQRISSDRRAFKADFMETFAKDEVSPDELKALFDTKKPVIEEVMQLAAAHIAEFHSILTPEQRATLIAEMESHGGRRCRFFR